MFRTGAINAAHPVNWESPLNRGLVGWWLTLPQRMGGNRLMDLCQPGNHGTLTSSPTWGSAAGRPGGYGSVKFSGSNYVSCGGGTALDVAAGDFSFCCWAQWTTTSAAFPMCKTTGASTNGYDLLLNRISGGASLRLNGGDATVDSTSSSLNDGAWHHLCGTRVSGYVSFFVDGVETGATTFATSITNTSAPLVFGGRNTTAFAACSVDDCRVFNRASSASEVHQLYNDARTGYQQTLNRLSRTSMATQAGSATGNRRRRVLICGAN